MSLINDALKRAKQAQQQAPPPPSPGPQLHPLADVPSAPRMRGRLWLGLPGATTLLVLLVIGYGTHTRGPKPAAAASLNPDASPTSHSPPPPASSGPLTTTSPIPAPTVPANPGAQPLPGPVAGHAMTAGTNPPAARPAEAQVPGEATNPPAIAPSDATASAPPPIRLQAIIFHPTRPSAIISGKTLFVGDTLGEMRLVAIDRESATLVAGGQTNLLRVP